MKKKYRNLFIGLGFPICSILALSMISCKKNETSEEQPNNDAVIKQEIDRINNLDLSLKSLNLFKNQLNSNTVLNEINGFSKFDTALDNYVYVVIDDSLINPKVTNVIEKETGKSVCSIMYLTTERYNWMIEIMERWFKETNTK